MPPLERISVFIRFDNSPGDVLLPRCGSCSVGDPRLNPSPSCDDYQLFPRLTTTMWCRTSNASLAPSSLFIAACARQGIPSTILHTHVTILSPSPASPPVWWALLIGPARFLPAPCCCSYSARDPRHNPSHSCDDSQPFPRFTTQVVSPTHRASTVPSSSVLLLVLGKDSQAQSFTLM